MMARILLGERSLADRFRSEVFAPLRAVRREELLESRAKGGLRQDVDPDPILDLVYGVLLYRALMGECLDEAVADAIAAIVDRSLDEPAEMSAALLQGSLDALRDPFVVCASLRDEAGILFFGFRVAFANRAAGVFMGREADTLMGAAMPDMLPNLAGSRSSTPAERWSRRAPRWPRMTSSSSSRPSRVAIGGW